MLLRQASNRESHLPQLAQRGIKKTLSTNRFWLKVGRYLQKIKTSMRPQHLPITDLMYLKPTNKKPDLMITVNLCRSKRDSLKLHTSASQMTQLADHHKLTNRFAMLKLKRVETQVQVTTKITKYRCSRRKSSIQSLHRIEISL